MAGCGGKKMAYGGKVKKMEKGGKVEKLPPGSAYNLGSLDKSGKPQWSPFEIRTGKDKKKR